MKIIIVLIVLSFGSGCSTSPVKPVEYGTDRTLPMPTVESEELIRNPT